MQPVAGKWWPACALSAVLGLAGPAAWAQTSPPSAAADTAHFIAQRTPSGVRYVFHARGTGARAQPGHRVAVRYTGFLPDGHVFDASAAQGSLFRFRVGRHEAIAGLDELLPLLPAGSRVRAWVPASLAYGAKGVRNPDDDTKFLIPPATDLVFELEVVSVR
jgi:FKBP-type peptidyl-prolyl cis-trans isomerase